LILSSSSIHLAPPLLDPCCVGGDLEGGGSSGGWLQGEGEGRPRVGKRGGWRSRKGKNRGATTRVLWEKETTHQMSLYFASNGPQLFPHIHTPKINLWQHFFWDITWGRPFSQQGRVPRGASPSPGDGSHRKSSESSWLPLKWCHPS
jgi:hypothetical protein